MNRGLRYAQQCYTASILKRQKYSDFCKYTLEYLRVMSHYVSGLLSNGSLNCLVELHNCKYTKKKTHLSIKVKGKVDILTN